MPLKLYAGLAALVLILSVAGYIYHSGAKNASNAIEIKSDAKIISIKEKQDEIKDHRATSAGVVVRLRNGTF